MNGMIITANRSARVAAARRTLVAAAFTVAGLAAAGCGMLPARRPPPEPVVVRELPPPVPRTDGAIYQAGQQMELFADLKARRVGDVVTVRLVESTNASKNAVTKTQKTTTVNDTGPTLFGHTFVTHGVPIGTVGMNGASSFDGEGTSTQSNSLAGSITVTVVAVRANGNLIVQGDKTLRLNQGDETVRISGVVRPADIASDNSVTSDRVADARIAYSGRGVINSSNSMGWLARFFNSGYAPY